MGVETSTVAVVGGVVLGGFLAMVLVSVVAERAPLGWQRASLRLFGLAAVLAGTVELACGLLLRRELATFDPQQRRAFAHLVGEIDDDGLDGTGLTPLFAPHPFLNFALNPEAMYLGQRQFNPDLLIRRSEPLRPRRAVRWRVLVLGGSTTFNDGVAREEDTWVRRLEAQMRATYGAEVDVINGGVSGYALVDNLLHYTLLLRTLEPDVVVLFTGINDVHPRLFAGLRADYAHARRRWAGGQSRHVDVLRPFVGSRAVRLSLARSVRAGELGHIYASVMPDYPAVADWSAALTRSGPETYAGYLDFAVRTFEAQGAKVAIVPQVWSSRPGDVRDAVFGAGVAEHNDVNERVARARGVAFARALPAEFVPDDLWDNCHFNVQGNVKMAATVQRFLEAEGLTPKAREP